MVWVVAGKTVWVMAGTTVWVITETVLVLAASAGFSKTSSAAGWCRVGALLLAGTKGIDQPNKLL